MKYGITETVKTINSKIKINDIIYNIVEKKANAIKYFLEGEEFNQAIVFGAYLCGNFVADTLTKDCDEVILVDVHPHLKEIIINEKIKFMDSSKFNLSLRNGELNPDLVVDLTGIGGLSPEIISKLNPSVLIVENPKGTFDKDINNIDNSMDRLNKGVKRGLLNTFRTSKVSKTSGSMTLVIDTVMDSCNDLKELDGVLYAIPNLKYYEGILFHEKDIRKFIDEVNTPAITVSCLDEDLENEINNILLKNIDRIYSYVEKIK
ncbi:DUF1188 domain-containing protein [Methanococcus aeolicus]|uniref:DUF1188 domain-containing protein n=1 Tax=Methanococcus aeolicus TaxID=42879 RepID=UPI0021C6CC80|nr:DUF1188 domain-containing protein [Methanococcus aeolicus]UXM84867.1 DUF1188 domain-containing protein [Methanococcus aeolicus]